MTEYDGFGVDRDDSRGLATIMLDVPGKMNRVSMPAREQLATVFDDLGAMRPSAIVLTGAGDQAFTGGGDIPGFMERSPEHLSRLAWNVAAAERCPKPVIARIRGYCLGVGFELALACDFRVASDDAQLGLPEIGLGMIPGSGGAARRADDRASRAKDVIMRRKRIGRRGARLGLVCEVVPAPTSSTGGRRVVDELAGSRRSRRDGEAGAQPVYDAPLSIGLELEGLAYGLLRSHTTSPRA